MIPRLMLPVRSAFICAFTLVLLLMLSPKVKATDATSTQSNLSSTVANIVINGDFESQMSGWTQVEPVAESGDTYSGVVSAKVGMGGRVYQNVDLAPNTEYMFEVYIDGEGTAGVTNGGSINVVETFNKSDWTRISATFTTGSAPGSVEVFGAGGSSGDVRFDDFALTPIGTGTPAPTAQPTATTPPNGSCAPIPSQIVDELVWDLEGDNPHPLVDDCTLRFVPLEAQHTTPNGNGWRHEYKIKSALRVAMSETYEEFGATIKVDMSDGGKTIVAQHHASDTGTIMKLYVADSSETGFDSGANTTPGDGIFNVYVRILNESGSEEKQWLGNIESGDTFSFYVLNDFGYVEVSAFGKSFGINVEDDSASYLKFGHYLQSQYPNGTDCGTHGDSASFAQCYDDIGITEAVITMTDVTYIRSTSSSPTATPTTQPTPTDPNCTPIPSYITDGSVWALEGENPHPLVNACTLRFVPLEAQVATTNGNGWRHEYKIDEDIREPLGNHYERFEATYTVDMSDGGKSIIAQYHGDDPTLMKLYFADTEEDGLIDSVGGNGVFDLYVRLRTASLNGGEDVFTFGTLQSGDTFDVVVENNNGTVTVSALGQTITRELMETSADYLKFGNYVQGQYTNDPTHPYGGEKCKDLGIAFDDCYDMLGITESAVTMTDVSYVRTSTPPVEPTATSIPTVQATQIPGSCAPIPSQIVDELVWDLEGENPHPLVDDCTLRFVPLEAQHTTPNGNGWRHEYKIKSDLRVAMSETYEEFGATIKVDMSDGGKTIVAQHHASDTGTIMKLYVADSSETGFDSGANTIPGDGIFNVYVRILNESGSEEKQWLGNIESGDTFSFYVLNDYGYVEVSAFGKSFGINVEDDSASYLKFGHYLQSQYPNGTDCGTHGDSASFAQCYDDIGITEAVVTMTDVTYVRATGTQPTPTATPTVPSSCAATTSVVADVTESTYDMDNDAVGSNVVDGSLDTRWSGQGNEAWVQLRLNGSYSLDGVLIAFHKGDERTATFEVQVSSNGSSWSTVYSGTSSGASTALESFPFDSDNVAYVRVVGYGNTSNDWNSLTEVALCVSSVSPTATPTSIVPVPTTPPTATPTPMPTTAPAVYTADVDYVDADNAEVWFDATTTLNWVDLHYRVNGGQQLNVRMVEEGGRWTWDVSNLDNGDEIEYWFTYFNGVAQGSSTATYVHNVIAPTATALAPTAVPTAPPPPSVDTIYVSSSSGGSVDGISFSDEDILAVDMATGAFMMVYDGSDVGMSGASGRDTGAFYILDDGSILISTVGDTDVPDVGAVSDSDILRFVPTALGMSTAGTFEMYFDGSDVGLTTNSEDIDALTVLDDGSLLISTAGSATVPDISVKDEDLLRFVPSSLGEDTDGEWSLYFDGSDVSLTDADEDVWGVSADSSGTLYVTTKSTFSVAGLTGEGSDVIACGNASLGSATNCNFIMLWIGLADGYGGELIDGLHVGAANVLNLNTSMSRAAERVLDEGTVEDFNNADLNDNGRIEWITPETLVSVPLAVGLDTAAVSQSLPLLYTIIGLLAGTSIFMIWYREGK